MAFNGLYDYTDRLAEAYVKTENEGLKTAIITLMIDYYTTALKPAKFKDQKQYCYNKIWELCPAFAEGYFGKKIK